MSLPKDKKNKKAKGKFVPKWLAKKKSQKVNENFLVLGFIKSLTEKNYRECDKYLQGHVDQLVTKKIENAVKKASN